MGSNEFSIPFEEFEVWYRNVLFLTDREDLLPMTKNRCLDQSRTAKTSHLCKRVSLEISQIFLQVTTSEISSTGKEQREIM